MCFRPSAADGARHDNVQTGTCPTCGLPVAASVGITGGTCPHCGGAIPSSTSPQPGQPDGGGNVRIL